MSFIAELQNLEYAIGAAVLLGAFWWGYILTRRPLSVHKR
jgi:hypothetical protein